MLLKLYYIFFFLKGIYVNLICFFLMRRTNVLDDFIFTHFTFCQTLTRILTDEKNETIRIFQ